LFTHRFQKKIKVPSSCAEKAHLTSVIMNRKQTTPPNPKTINGFADMEKVIFFWRQVLII
jgi:hypothetical protein